MKSKRLFKSFRMEIVCYSILSLFYTIITEVILYNLFFYAKNFILTLLNNRGSITDHAIQIEKNTKDLIDAANPTGFSYDLKSLLLVNKDYLAVTMIIALALGTVLFIVYFLLLTRKLGNYLDEITAGINQIAEGDFNVRIRIKNEDEFAMIAASVNKMASDIGQMVENERNVENTKTELITNVAHDLRTPLTSIIGYLDLAASGRVKEEDKQRYLTIAYDKAERLEQLIEDLFSFTKFSSGEVKMNKTVFDLVTFMQQMVDEFYPSFQDNQLDYELNCNKDSAMIMADGNLMARAIANLMSNAVKYGKDGKKINMWVKVNEAESIVKVGVMNYGEVIPKKDLENVFDKFYRVENSRSASTGGTGLGLAIAKKIVLMHDGDIELKSDLKGTILEVTLPLYKKESVEEMAQ